MSADIVGTVPPEVVVEAVEAVEDTGKAAEGIAVAEGTGEAVEGTGEAVEGIAAAVGTEVAEVAEDTDTVAAVGTPVCKWEPHPLILRACCE